MSINNIIISGEVKMINNEIGIQIHGIFKPIIYLFSWLHLIHISPIIIMKDNSLLEGNNIAKVDLIYL